MRPSFAQKMEIWFRHRIAFIITFLSLLVMMMPVPLPSLWVIKPDLLLIYVFFWSIYCPEEHGMGTAFFFGILEDLMENILPGTNALILVMVSWSVENQRRFLHGKPFVVTWWGFSILAFGALIAKWFLFSISQSGFVPFIPPLASYMMTIADYPLFGWIGAKALPAITKED